MEGNLCLLELGDLRQFLDSSSLVFLEEERPDLCFEVLLNGIQKDAHEGAHRPL